MGSGALVLGLVLALAASAEAHAILVGSSPRNDEVLPAAPATLLMRFNSRVVPSLSHVTCAGPDGRPARLTRAGPPASDRLMLSLPRLAPGRYVVDWRVLAVDGHVTTGRFAFTIGARR